MTDERTMRENWKTVSHSGEKIPDEIPTTTIKKCEVQLSVDTDTLRSSLTPTAGQRGQLTYLHLATNIEKTTFALTDRGGTFDVFQLGTTATLNRRDEIVLQGDLTKPIHSIQGTFGVYNTGGSYTGGSFTIAWEIIKK